MSLRPARPAPGPWCSACGPRGSALRWTDRPGALQHRVVFARQVTGEEWTGVYDGALPATLDEWLVPHLTGATGRADLDALDVEAAVRVRLGHRQARALDRVAPSCLVVASGARTRWTTAASSR